MRARASPAGGWSTRTPPRLASHHEEELQIPTMVEMVELFTICVRRDSDNSTKFAFLDPEDH